MKILYFIVALLFVAGTLQLFPFEVLVSNENADNPQHCPYYITLQSTLASNALLSTDEANIRFIKQKMLKFENEVVNSTYQKNYINMLRQFNLGTVSHVSSPLVILGIANAVFPIIDGYYLDPQFFCTTPLYEWNATNTRRILRYNLNGLYDEMPNKFSRILVSTSTVYLDWLFGGSPPGYFVNNQSTTMDTRFMTGIPMLTALYVQPQFDYVEVGGYYSVMPWSFFGVAHFLNPLVRKVIDIGGIDVFTVAKSDLKKTIIPGAKPLDTKTPEMFSKGVQSYINTQSYGMAYLAHHIIYENSQSIKQDEDVIKHYFARHRDPSAFVAVTKMLYQKLMQLTSVHDIILESSHRDIQGATTGSVDIKGIVGERAFFVTNCHQKFCTFVFNVADAPGWHAFVNGNASPIERANFAFMATRVPEGQSKVWFIYQPDYQVLSYFLSICSLILLTAFGIKRYKNYV